MTVKVMGMGFSASEMDALRQKLKEMAKMHPGSLPWFLALIDSRWSFTWGSPTPLVATLDPNKLNLVWLL